MQGRIHSEKDDDKAALEALNKALELEPTHQAALYSKCSRKIVSLLSHFLAGVLRRLNDENEEGEFEGETDYAKYYKLGLQEEAVAPDHFETKGRWQYIYYPSL